MCAGWVGEASYGFRILGWTIEAIKQTEPCQPRNANTWL